MSGRILMEVCEVMTWDNFFELALVKMNKDTTNWDLIFFLSFDSLIKSHFHPIFHLLLTEIKKVFLHAMYDKNLFLIYNDVKLYNQS